MLEKTPRLPSVDLAVWVGSDVEPCPRCGSHHEDRRKWVCDACNRIVCAGCIRTDRDGIAQHWVRYPDLDVPEVCGEVSPTTDLWPQHRAALEQLLHELEGQSENYGNQA